MNTPKISKLEAEQLFDMLPAVSEIVDTLGVMDWIADNKVTLPAGTPADKVAKEQNKMLGKLVRFILINSTKVKEPFFEVIGIATGMTGDDAKHMGGLELLATLTNLIYDKAAIDFFVQLTMQQGEQATTPHTAPTV